MTARHDHRASRSCLLNRRYGPGRYRLVDRNGTADHIPPDQVDDAPVNRIRDPYRTERGTHE
ncbi:hypothetical protein GA0070616_0416 [Micromonospora nigra]|uniref:Uncharacterized protein n=1 Tax=Micromonospora nigra TaxID=145857 RepID=A0A1C6RB34_9ACTN|nr:hypothetical protein [Micromonospora nigra]SCL14356.1 hypothetical protein GA0070616_0416 [Micromonospora nigra]